METDQGGYYGLKGYLYQYNKSLNELLHKTENDDYIELEQIEDLSDRNKLVQIKYKERSEFYPSSIKKPVVNLLNIMSKEERCLYLYCYFPNLESKTIDDKTIKIDTEIIISEKYLDEILGKEAENYTKDDKEEFVSKFRIKFTKDYVKEFEEIISKISSSYDCDDETALLHYSNMITYLLEKVIDNSPKDTEKRKCTKEEIDNVVNNSKNIFIHTYLEELVGIERYYSIIRKKLRFHRKSDTSEKIFIFDDSINLEVPFYVNLIQHISAKFLKIVKSGPRKKRVYRVDSGAPYIFIHNISTKKLNNIKNMLFKNELELIDGFPFNGSNFNVGYLTQETKPHTNFKIRVINKKNELFEVGRFLEQNLLDVYYFNSEKNKELTEEIHLNLDSSKYIFSHISIDSLDNT